MSSFATDLVDSIIELPFEFAKVITEAGPRPVAALLLLVGGLFVFVSVAVFGYLTFGAVMDLVMPDVSSEPSNREAR